jgi:hypothetical protein
VLFVLLSVTVESLTVKLDIVGAWLSIFVMYTVLVAVDVLPALSATVNVKTVVVVPHP